MKFSYFDSVRASQGEELTYEKFIEVCHSERLMHLMNDIKNETDKDKRGNLKKQLPIITWQAYFPGRRANVEAQPSGLFMLDIDHVEHPIEMMRKLIFPKIKECGIVLISKTASAHGIRVVAKCRPQFYTLPGNQRWLAEQIGVPYDPACKDLARSSYVCHESYTFYMDAKAIFQDPTPEWAARINDYTSDTAKIEREAIVEWERKMKEEGKKLSSHRLDEETAQEARTEGEAIKEEPKEEPKDEPKEAEQTSLAYRGILYADIVKEWFERTGGEPVEGDRNTRLYQLAVRLRYICDFNEAKIVSVLPTYGLPSEEVKALVHSACGGSRMTRMPKDLQDTLDSLDKQMKIKSSRTTEADDEADDIDIESVIKLTSTEVNFVLPPLFKQWHDVSPDDFKRAVTLCQLPILGALGSRLRAEYLDGKMHSPSFQVSLEAPQASGKSFLVRLINYELEQMKEADEVAREKEREYQEEMKKITATKTKVKKEDLPTKPDGIIRYLPATISVTKLLMRMQSARGLHCFAFAEEIDTVKKAYSRGFSNLSEMLRVSFDNEEYGQDYASDNSFSGNVRLYYNTLFSGTPKAMCRFYPDVEDGLVSRVLFVTLPDQFGKPMPVWRPFTAKEDEVCHQALTRLSEVSLIGEEVQPEYILKLNFLNKVLEKWIIAQQVQAVKENDRTRDIFCRRASVVGFRAGMLAWFLFGEIQTPYYRRQVSNFAVWVANSMLNQHLLRFNLKETNSNTTPYKSLFDQLPDEFTYSQFKTFCSSSDAQFVPRMVLYKWRLAGLIEEQGKGKTSNKIIDGVIRKKGAKEGAK